MAQVGDAPTSYVAWPEFRHLRLGTHFMIDCTTFRTISLTAISVTTILGSPNIAAAESTSHVSAEGARISYSIPAQPLASALQEYARQTHAVLAVPPLLVSGRASPSVVGEFTSKQALDRLLTGTGLRPAHSEDGVLRLVENEPELSQSQRVEKPVTSQVEDTSEPETIVVLGYRKSLNEALEIKKEAAGSQDVILAEDVAAFPDQNLAESLQRVAGVAISRDSGEGRQISLRGLGPDFTRTKLNGMEVLSNTASGLDSRGAVSRTRSFDYSVFASELFNQVVVEKSYAAEQDEGGIGGSVLLRTAKPFDYPGRTVVSNIKLQSNQYTDDVTPRAVVLASDQWGSVGALISAAYSSADNIEFGYRNWNWSQINFGAANVGSSIPEATRNLLVGATGTDRVWNSRAQTYGTWYNERDRLGLTGTLQYHPDDSTDVTLDVLFGRLENDRDETVIGNAGTNGISANDVRGTQVLQAVTLNSFNSITAATVSGVDLRTESKPTEDGTDFWQAALNGHTALTDALELTGLLGWSRSEFDSNWQRVYLESVGHTTSFAGLDTENPVNSYDFDPTDPEAWDLQSIQWQRDYIESEFYTAAGGLQWNIDDASSIKGGAEFKQFENAAYRYGASANYEDRNALAVVPTLVTPNSSRAPYIVADVPATFAALGQSGALSAANLAAGTDYGVKEQTLSGYSQYDLNTRLLGVGVRANVGVRYYHTELTSSGTSVTNGGLVPVRIEHSYSGWLPAANVAFDVTKDLVIRLSANRNISRPSLADLSSSATVNVAGFGGTISAGNPNLTPYKANSVEGSVEFYDGTRGFLSLAAFYKEMESFVTTQTSSVRYDQTGYPLSLLQAGQDGSIIFNFTRPVNGPGASIRGAELAAKRDFDFLPGPLSALGVLANVTYAEGETDVFYNGVPHRLSLVDLSKWSYNATLYYDTQIVGARLSVASRSRYRRGSGGNGNIGEFFAPSTVFDATAYYNVTTRFQLRVEGLNLSDEEIIQYADVDARRLMTSSVSGRTLSLGGSYRF